MQLIFSNLQIMITQECYHKMKIFLPDFQFSSSNLMLPRIRLDVRQRFSQSEKFMFRIRSPLNPDTVEKEIQGQLTD